jgi:hypothetical protein
MEETDVCYPTSAVLFLQQAIPNSCPAKALPPSQRLQIGVQALVGSQTVMDLAGEFDVSRKFVYRQSAIAEQALTDAFDPRQPEDRVLFHLAVTKQFLRQLILALVLICHCSMRGVVELLRDVFDVEISLGTVFNVVHAAVARAREQNQAYDLSPIRVVALDEIFQADQPVLVGVDALSTYCCLLSLEDNRDATTWGVRLLELQERGLDPECSIADAAPPLRSAHTEVFPHRSCRSDVFHGLQQVTEVVTNLENRAYQAMTTRADLARKLTSSKRRQGKADRSYVKQLTDATKKQAQAIALADAVALLGRWLHYDVLALAGPTHADRLALYDFIVAELTARIPLATKHLGKLVTYLKGQRDDLLKFALQLDRDFADLAAAFAVPPALVRELFAVHTLELDDPRRWRRAAPLQRLLGERYFLLGQAVDAVRRHTVRASSVVENLNSRLRNYFFLRRHLGNDYLSLLQFFLNHRRYPRSEHPERVNRSPAELLTGQTHPHWLEMLGYTRFSRN